MKHAKAESCWASHCLNSIILMYKGYSSFKTSYLHERKGQSPVWRKFLICDVCIAPPPLKPEQPCSCSVVILSAFQCLLLSPRQSWMVRKSTHVYMHSEKLFTAQTFWFKPTILSKHLKNVIHISLLSVSCMICFDDLGQWWQFLIQWNPFHFIKDRLMLTYSIINICS